MPEYESSFDLVPPHPGPGPDAAASSVAGLSQAMADDSLPPTPPPRHHTTHTPTRNPHGSRAGSAAGVGAGFAPLAVGTETDGLVASPAGACGVVGVKPTMGLVSRSGIVPISLAQDTAGPMAPSVADAAALLSVLA